MATGRAGFRATLIWLGLAVALASGQSHTAGWSFIGDANAASPYAVTVGRVDRHGVFTTILALNRLLAYDHGQGGALEPDDQTYVVAILSKVNTGKLLRVDSQGTILQTLPVLTQPPPQGGFVHDVMVDPNGDYIVVTGPPTAAQKACLLKVDRQGAVSTVFAGQNLGYATSVTMDIDTGNFLLLDNRTRDLYSITPDGATVTSVGRFGPTLYILNQVTQHVGSGDTFVGSWSTYGAVLLRMNAIGQSSVYLPSGLYGAYGVHADRSSAANPRLLVGSTSVDSGLFYVDLRTQAITTLVSTAVGFPLVYHKVFPSRDVATIRQAPSRWDVRLHFPGEAGNAYVVGLGLSGVRPGLGLPDRRRLCFNLDDLTRLSLGGLLGLRFTGYAGRLDAAGRATATLDTSPWPGLRGLRVWIQALTLDPNAPLGIRTIPDPVVLVL